MKSHSNIKSIIELYNKNIVKLTLEELNKYGISKIIKPLNLKEDDKGIYICFKNQTLTLEACLIQDYYNQKNVLPKWNVAL